MNPQEQIFSYSSDDSRRPPLYFNPLPSIKKALRERFKNHRTRDGRYNALRNAYQQVSQLGVDICSLDNICSWGSVPLRLAIKTLDVDPRTAFKYITILAEEGAWDVKDETIWIHGFTAGQPRYRTHEAIKERLEHRRVNAADRQRNYRRSKRENGDIAEWASDFENSIASLVSHSATKRSEPTEIVNKPLQALQRSGDNSDLISNGYTLSRLQDIGTPPIAPSFRTPSSLEGNSITLLPLTLLERRSELERQDDLLTESPKDRDQSKAKSVDKSIPKPFNSSTEKPDTLPAMVCIDQVVKTYRPPITRQRFDRRDVSRETSFVESSPARDADGRPILSAEELKRRLGPSSIVEKYCVGVEKPTAPIPPSPAQKNVYKPAFTAKKIERTRHSKAMTEKSGLSPEIQAIIEKCQQQSREREAQKSVEIKILESPQMEFTPSPPPVPKSVPVPLGVSSCETQKTPTPVMPPQLPAPQQRLTHSAAAHLISQHHEMPPEMADRIVAIGATYTQAQQALSLTADAKQQGRIKKSPVGYFLKTMENLSAFQMFHVKHGTG